MDATSTKTGDQPDAPPARGARSGLTLQVPLSLVFIVQIIIVAAGFAVVIALTLVNEDVLITEKVREIIAFSMERNEKDIMIPLAQQVRQVRQLQLQLTSRGISCKTLNSTAHADYIQTWLALNIMMQNSSIAAFAYENWMEDGEPPDPFHPSFTLWGECGCEQASQLCGFNRNASRYAFHAGPKSSDYANATAVNTGTDTNPGKASYVTSSIQGIPSTNTVGLWTAPYVWAVLSSAGVQQLTTLYSYYVCMAWHASTGSCIHSIGMDASLDSISSIIASFASTPQSTVALIDVRTNFLIAHNGAFPQLNASSASSAQPYSADATPSGAINRAVIDAHRTCVASQNCKLRIRDDGDDIASSYWITAANGLSLMLVDITPRSYHYGRFDENRRLGIIVGVVVPVFVSVVCLLVWLSVVIPLHAVGDLMTNAATMRADRVGKRSKWIFLREILRLQQSYEAMHTKLLELRPFVPHYLFVSAIPHAGDDTLSTASGPELTTSTGEVEDAAPDSNPLRLNVGSVGASSTTSHSSTSLVLGNLSAENLNRFYRMHCTVMYVAFDHNYADVAMLNHEVESTMAAVIEAANACDGVLDQQRPDGVIITFGAHHALAAHQSAAASCALKIMKLLPVYMRGFVGIVLDTAEYLVGTCGGKDRFSRALFGERFLFMRLVQQLAMDTLDTRVVCTEKTAAALTKQITIPIDYIVARPGTLMGTISGVKLFEVLEPKKYVSAEATQALATYRDVFAKLLGGEVSTALDVLHRSPNAEFSTSLEEHRKRLKAVAMFIAAHPRPSYERKELVPYETFGVPMVDRGVRQQRRMENIKMSDLNFSTAQPSTNERHDSVTLLQPFFGVEDDPSSYNESSINNCPRAEQGEAAAVDCGGGDCLFEMFAPTVDLTTMDDDVEDSGELPMTFEDKGQGVVWTRSRDLLGTGTFASVYRGISSSGTCVALKCIDLSSRHIVAQDVVLEVNTACKLHHENIVNYLSWVRTSRYLAIAMEFVPGGSLMSTLDLFGPLPLQALRRFALDCLNGLAYLHSKSITHADVKPHNILLGMDGACKLSDFGSTVYSGSVLLVDGAPSASDVFSIRGTALYMSPEVADGDQPTPASDVWSLGITLYQLFTGAYPWKMTPGKKGDVRALMRNDAFFIQAVAGNTITAEVGPEIEGPLHDFLSSCLRRDKSQRPTVAALLKHALFL